MFYTGAVFLRGAAPIALRSRWILIPNGMKNHYSDPVSGNMQSVGEAGKDSGIYRFLRNMAWVQGVLTGMAVAFSSFWLTHKLGNLFIYGDIQPELVKKWGYVSAVVWMVVAFFSSRACAWLTFRYRVSTLGDRRIYVVSGLVHIAVGLFVFYGCWESGDYSFLEASGISLSLVGLGIVLWSRPAGLVSERGLQGGLFILIVNSLRYYIKAAVLTVQLLFPLYVLGATLGLVQEINHSTGSLMSVLQNALFSWCLPVFLFVLLSLFYFFMRYLFGKKSECFFVRP